MTIKIKKSHEGLLHKNLGVAAGKPIPEAKLEKAKHSKSAAVRKRATFAENAKHFHHGKKKGAVDRSAHYPGNPGFPSSRHAGTSPPKDYSNEPVAPKNKIADKPLVQNASLGNEVSKIVPHPHQFGKPPIGGAHGFGHSGAQRQGHVRLSGAPSAHRIGKR